MENYEARIGDQVKDRVSGFTGTVVALHRFLQGCDRMSVQPPTAEDGSLPEPKTFDAPDLKVIKKQAVPYRKPTDKSYVGDVELADKVRDPVSGFGGVAVARHIYLNGCDQITVQPGVGKEKAKLPDTKVFDAPRLVVVKRRHIRYETPASERRRTGGPEKFMPYAKPDGRR